MLTQWNGFLEQLDDRNLSALVREAELGQLNFTSAVEKPRVIRGFIASLSQEEEAELPASLTSEVSSHVDALTAIIQQMRDFTLAQDQAQTQRNNIENSLEQERQWLAATVRPQLRAHITDVSSRLAEITDAHTRATSAAEEATRLLE